MVFVTESKVYETLIEVGWGQSGDETLLKTNPSVIVMSDPQDEPSVSLKKSAVRNDADADEEILHPTFEVYRHTLMRGANMGAFLTLVLGPPVLFVRGVRQPSELLRRLAGACAKGVVSGMFFNCATVFVVIRPYQLDFLFHK